MRTFPVCCRSRNSLLLLAVLLGSAVSFTPTFGGLKQKSASFRRRSDVLQPDAARQKKSTKLGLADNIDLSLIDVQAMSTSRVACECPRLCVSLFHTALTPPIH